MRTGVCSERDLRAGSWCCGGTPELIAGVAPKWFFTPTQGWKRDGLAEGIAGTLIRWLETCWRMGIVGCPSHVQLHVPPREVCGGARMRPTNRPAHMWHRRHKGRRRMVQRPACNEEVESMASRRQRRMLLQQTFRYWCDQKATEAIYSFGS